MTLCNYYLTNEDYARLSRKYLARTKPVELQLKARFLAITRLDTLSDIEAKERHIRSMLDLLEDDKYKNVAYGKEFMLDLIEILLREHE